VATLTLPVDRLAELGPDDLITAIDGRTLGRPLTVAERMDADGAVPLVNPLGTGTRWRLYPDTAVAESVTIERPEEATTATTAAQPELTRPAAPAGPTTARQARTVTPVLPQGGELLEVALQALGMRLAPDVIWSRMRGNPMYVLELQALADAPNGLITMEPGDRGRGTTLGFMCRRYGWCYKVSQGRWQITPMGLAAILAWDEQEG
jgi:hypothetical protein